MEKIFVIVLILIEVTLKIIAQAPTVPTAGPTDPTTTTTTVFIIPTPSTVTGTTTVPTPPLLSSTSSTTFVTTTSSLNFVSTTSSTTASPFTCPPDGITHLPTDHCQTFIVCVYGRPHPGNCSTDTLFDPLTSSCLPAANVDCGTRLRP